MNPSQNQEFLILNLASHQLLRGQYLASKFLVLFLRVVYLFIYGYKGHFLRIVNGFCMFLGMRLGWQWVGL